jgi:hypothetical protein
MAFIAPFKIFLLTLLIWLRHHLENAALAASSADLEPAPLRSEVIYWGAVGAPEDAAIDFGRMPFANALVLAPKPGVYESTLEAYDFFFDVRGTDYQKCLSSALMHKLLGLAQVKHSSMAA